jgi:hypothetical protein
MRKSIMWLLVLMLLTTSLIISAVPAFNAGFMLVNAQTDVATSALISVEPSIATGNQVVQVNIRIEPAPPTPTDIFRNLTVTFVRSDGYTNRLGPYDTRPDGSQDFALAAPDLSGNHTIKLTFPGQTFANDTIHYLPSQSQTTLTVSPPPPPPPQPTGGSWEQKKSMQQARGKLGVAAVNGKIYAIGGSTETGRTPNSVGTDYKANGWIVGTNEEYDPATNTWSFKKTMPTPRFDFATVAYQNKIY